MIIPERENEKKSKLFASGIVEIIDLVIRPFWEPIEQLCFERSLSSFR